MQAAGGERHQLMVLFWSGLWILQYKSIRQDVPISAIVSRVFMRYYVWSLLLRYGFWKWERPTLRRKVLGILSKKTLAFRPSIPQPWVRVFFVTGLQYSRLPWGLSIQLLFRLTLLPALPHPLTPTPTPSLGSLYQSCSQDERIILPKTPANPWSHGRSSYNLLGHKTKQKEKQSWKWTRKGDADKSGKEMGEGGWEWGQRNKSALHTCVRLSKNKLIIQDTSF